MSTLFVNQAADIFKSAEEWNAFLEMVSVKDSIINAWYEKLDREIESYFHENRIEAWSFKRNSMGSYVWFVTEFGQDSLALWYEYWTQFSLFARHEQFNTDDIRKHPKFHLLINTFGTGQRFDNGGYFIKQTGDFSFSNSPYNGNFDKDSLAWYASNKTEELLKQIVQKVDKFRKDEQLTKIIIESCKPKLDGSL